MTKISDLLISSPAAAVAGADALHMKQGAASVGVTVTQIGTQVLGRTADVVAAIDANLGGAGWQSGGGATSLDGLSDAAISSPATGQILRYNGTNFVNSAGELVVNTRTANYTLVLADASTYIRMNLAGANNLTVPLNATVAFPVGTVIQLRQVGAGKTTVVAASGVTITSPNTLMLREQHSSVALIKVDTDTWDLTGDLEV